MLLPHFVGIVMFGHMCADVSDTESICELIALTDLIDEVFGIMGV